MNWMWPDLTNFFLTQWYVSDKMPIHKMNERNFRATEIHSIEQTMCSLTRTQEFYYFKSILEAHFALYYTVQHNKSRQCLLHIKFWSRKLTLAYFKSKASLQFHEQLFLCVDCLVLENFCQKKKNERTNGKSKKKNEDKHNPIVLNESTDDVVLYCLGKMFTIPFTSMYTMKNGWKFSMSFFN